MDAENKKNKYSDDHMLNGKSSGNGVQYDKRDKLYTDMLKKCIIKYDAKTNVNAVYKNIFFYVTIVLLCVMILIPLLLLFTIARKETSSAADIAVVIGSVAGIVSSIMVLPKIIAEHLFPANEDVHINDLVKSLQENDIKIGDSPRRQKCDSSQRKDVGKDIGKRGD